MLLLIAIDETPGHSFQPLARNARFQDRGNFPTTGGIVFELAIRNWIKSKLCAE